MAGGTLNRQAFIQTGIGQGMSGAAILRELRDAGLGMRTQDFYSYYSNLAQAPEKDSRLAGLDRNTSPGFEDLTAMSTRTESGYAYLVGFTTKDRATDEINTRYISVRSDDPMTLADAEETAFDQYMSNPDYTDGTTLLGYSTTSALLLVPQSAA